MANILAVSSQAVAEAARALGAGEIVIIPTNRWFMICCAASAPGRIQQIFAAKKRSAAKQPAFILPCKECAPEYFQIGSGARRLIDGLWPGELSLLLRWREPSAPNRFPCVDTSAGLAYAPSGLLGEVASSAGIPLLATTPNVSDLWIPGQPGPPITLEEVAVFLQRSQLNVELVIDAGICPAFMPTTIVDCREVEGTPTILREGYVHARAVAAALIVARKSPS